MSKIILFELNEVPFRVLESYCRRNPDSTLARFYRKSTSVETVSPDTKWLHPWCTWPTLHRGVETEKHMLTNLSQNLTEVDEEFPPIWKILAESNISVGLGGSLHSWPLPTDLSNYSFYLPDTFASDSQAHPSELEVFQAFNLAMVDKSARNVSKGIALKEATDVIKNLRKLGFGPKTLYSIGNQLAHEALNPARKSRRRIIQSVLAFDAFMKQLETKKPDFSTFFTNHVASSMHRYWVAMFPEDFAKHDYAPDWIKQYEGEIDYALSVAETFLERLITFVEKNKEYKIVMASSMGQAAQQSTTIERQVYIEDADLFMRTLGVESHEYQRRRVMAPRFAVSVDPAKLQLFRNNMSNIAVGGKKVHFEERAEGFCMLHLGQENLKVEHEFAEINGTQLKFKDVGLYNTIIEDAAGSTGYHIPDGILLIYNPTEDGKSVDTTMPTTEIAPLLLQNFKVAIPDYMTRTQTQMI